MNRKFLHICGRLVVIVLLGVCNLAQAQSITSDSIIWHVNSIFEINTGSIVQRDEKIVTYGNDQLAWFNKDGELKKHFNITEMMGVWDDVSQPGSIIIRIAEGNITGNLIIQKNTVRTRIRLVYVDDGQPNVFEFFIHEITELNSQY